jgi:hypothetical protein
MVAQVYVLLEDAEKQHWTTVLIFSRKELSGM